MLGSAFLTANVTNNGALNLATWEPAASAHVGSWASLPPLRHTLSGAPTLRLSPLRLTRLGRG